MSIIKMREGFSQYGRPILFLLLAVFVLGAIFVIGMPAFQGGGSQGPANDTIAVVNGKKITRIELDEAFRRRNEMMGSTVGNSPLEISELMVSTLKQLVQKNVSLTAAEKEGISAGYFERRSEKARIIKEQLANVREQAASAMNNGSKTKTKPTDRAIDLWLSKLPKPTSLAQIEADLNKNLTPDVVREALLSRKLEEKIKAKAGVGNMDDAKLMSYFEMAKVRHIIITSGGLLNAQAEVRANKVLQEIKGGADFAAVAKQYSDDTSTKDKGGEIPSWIPVFRDKDIQGLKKGQVSGVIKSEANRAYRIVKVEDTKLDLPKDFQAKKSEYSKLIKDQLESEAIQEYYAKASEAAKVDIVDPEMKGYWLADQSRSAADPAQRDKLIAEAVKALKTASVKSQNQGGVRSKLAELYMMQGNNKQAISELNYVFETVRNEGADLRMMLGQLYIKTGEMKKAQEQLDIAADVGYANPSVHAQLITLFKMAGQPERSAEEEKWIADYQKRMQARQPAVAPVKTEKKPAPAPGG